MSDPPRQLSLQGGSWPPPAQDTILTLAVATCFCVPERLMSLVSDRLLSASLSQVTLAPELRVMARTVSPPLPGGSEGTEVSVIKTLASLRI